MVNGSSSSSRRSIDCAEQARYIAISQDEGFVILRRKVGHAVLVVASLFIGWYFLYVGASVFGRPLMRHRLVGHVDVALVFGVSQILFTFVLAWRYSRYARLVLDPLRAQIVADAARRSRNVIRRRRADETGGRR